MKAVLAIVMGLGIMSNISVAHAADNGDYLVKFAPSADGVKAKMLSMALPANTKVEDLELGGWVHVQMPVSKTRSFGVAINTLSQMPGVLYVQPNYKIHFRESPSLAQVREAALKYKAEHPLTFGGKDDCPIPGMCGGGGDIKDNPDIPAKPTQVGTGADPLFNNQWGMLDMGVQKAWNKSRGNSNIVVAVIDTGIDYTHEDLVENLWRNPGENGTDAQGRDKSNNSVDDDANGFVDDVIGWDFVSNDNKPFDLSVPPQQLLFGGGNPGHGTHCSGNVGARGDNGKGISGVAPNVSIMGLRFLSEKGEGDTAGAVKALNYALKMGANVTSNSWGSEGDDPGEAADNKALRDAIHESEVKGVLFVAAAGNGRSTSQMSPAVGYDNDTDAKPGMPATYPDDIIVSVAAIDSSNNLGSFSNYGATTVDIAAPGVKVFSTMVGNRYSDKVIDFQGMTANWDGTSMATPHVAGAVALYLSAHPNASWKETKDALIRTAVPVAALKGKVVANGKLNVEALMNQ